MKTPRSFLGTIAAALLPVTLFSFGVLFSAYQVLGSPQPVKDALADSGIYQSVIAESLQKTGAKAGDTATGALPLQDPGVQQAIEGALPPEVVQQKSEDAIDGVYRWLQGGSDSIAFNLDFADTKLALADKLAAHATSRVAALPPCADNSNQSAVSDPLNATCKPAGLDPAAAGETVKNEILNNKDFLPQSSLNANDLTSSTGQRLDQQLSAVPAVYEQVKWGAVISGALSLICTVAVLLLSGSLARGLRRFAWITLPVGIVSALLAWVAGFAMQKLTDVLTDNQSWDTLQATLVDALRLVTQDIRTWWLWYGIIVAGLGIVALILASVLRRHTPASSAGVDSTAPPKATATTPGVTTMQPITNEEARAATALQPTEQGGAPVRPGRNRKIQ